MRHGTGVLDPVERVVRDLLLGLDQILRRLGLGRAFLLRPWTAGGAAGRATRVGQLNLLPQCLAVGIALGLAKLLGEFGNLCLESHLLFLLLAHKLVAFLLSHNPGLRLGGRVV